VRSNSWKSVKVEFLADLKRCQKFEAELQFQICQVQFPVRVFGLVVAEGAEMVVEEGVAEVELATAGV